MDRATEQNMGILWSRLVVAEFARQGIHYACISPGYRDAPLVHALVHDDRIQKVMCIDERAAAYRALGHAKITGLPALLVCTSGTAGANYLPAVIEASHEQVPLIILTADRPFELLRSGANQVTDQLGFFGPFVRSSLALPPPSEDVAPAALLNKVAALVERAQRFPAGPVHLNMPLREPLEPRVAGTKAVTPNYLAQAEEALQKFSALPKVSAKADVAPSFVDLEVVAGYIKRAKRGLLLIGRLDASIDKDAIGKFAETLGWPVYCDITSSMRATMTGDFSARLVSAATKETLDHYRPDCIVHVGRGLVTKHFDRLIKHIDDGGPYIVASSSHDQQNPLHVASVRLTCREDSFAQGMLPHLPKRSTKQDRERPVEGLACDTRRASIESAIEQAPFCLPTIAHDTFRETAARVGAIFLGNSSTIRAFDAWADDHHKNRQSILCNRGVSGIEGQVATAIGSADALQRPVVIVLGDVSMIHDLNSLLMVKSAAAPVLIVIVNDQGGGIFRRMPIAQYAEVMSPFIETPHDYEFSGAAAMAGIPYQRVSDRATWREHLAAFIASNTSAIIECYLDPTENEQATAYLSSLP